MSGTTRRTSQFYNYPVPIETSVPWEEPPVQKNPPMSGSLLYYGAVLCETFNFVPQFLYNNAGFSSFGKVPNLQRYEARYDPAVIPVASETKEQGSFNATDVEHLQRPIDALEGPKFRYMSVADFHDGFASGRFTPTDVVNALLPLIRRDVEKPTTHSTAFIASRVDLITEAAAKSTKRWQEGKQLGALDGVPFAVKDEVDVQGYLTTHGSKRDYTARGNGTSWNVQQWQNAGAILIGKTNMHEMGLDTNGNNPIHGTPRNPYNSGYYCGGSSSGSAYAVAAGLVPFALGVDGGGSIRLPSSYCGIWGLKTSAGRISKIPTVDATLSNSVNGPMCADMATLEVAYRVQAIPDPNHIHSSRFPISHPLSARALSSRPKILGIHREWWNRCNPEARTICDQAMTYLEKNLGYKIIDISIPHVSIAQKAHAVTILAEAAAAVPDTTDLSAESKCLLSIGRVANGVDLLLAQRMRGLIMSHLAHLFEKHPGLIIMTPTTPEVGWPIKNDPADLNAYGISDGDMSVRSMEYVWLANFSGCPCLQMPVGYAKPQEGKGDPDEERIPIGMMGMGEWASEEELILLGYDVERYLREGYEGGRRKPKAWVDLMGLVESGRATK